MIRIPTSFQHVAHPKGLRFSTIIVNSDSPGQFVARIEGYASEITRNFLGIPHNLGKHLIYREGVDIAPYSVNIDR